MKLFLFILAIATSHFTLSQSAGGWSQVDVNQVNSDQDLRAILDFGVQYVISEGVANQTLNTLEYYVEDIESIESQVASGTNYRFTVDLANDQGGYATITFMVYDQSWTNTRNVTSYSFNDVGTGDSTGGIVGGWTQIPVSQLNTDADLESDYEFGLEYVISEGKQNGELSSTANYTVSNVNSIQSQLVSGYNYRYNVNLTSNEDGSARVVFVVNDQSWTGTKNVTFYFFIGTD